MASPLRLVVFDKTQTQPPFLTQSWQVGSAIGRLRGHIDAVYAAESWRDALQWLGEVEHDREIAEVQYWGHGKWGRAYVDNDILDGAALHEGHALEPGLAQLRERLSANARWWFRCCEVFGARRGHEFAQRFADYLGCTIAGHTYIIGPWQSGLHTLEPGTKPGWSDEEGLLEGTAAAPQKARWSRFWHPHTINCLRLDVPRGW